MKRRYSLLALFCLALLVTACGPQLQRPTVSPELVAWEREQQGRLALALQEERKQRLGRVFSRLSTYGTVLCEILTSTRGCPYQVELKEGDEVNAGADGTSVVVYTGMLRFVRDDDELALVLGHELAHNALDHVNKQRGNQIIGGVLGLILDIGIAAAGANTQGAFSRMGTQAGALAYSQEFEMEADYLGLYFATRAGFDITKAPDFWRRVGIEDPRNIKQNFAATHPSSPERSVLLEKTVNEIQTKQGKRDRLVPDTLVEIAKKRSITLPSKDEVAFPILHENRQPETVVRKDVAPKSTVLGTSAERPEQREGTTIRSAKVESTEKKHATTSTEAAKPASLLYVKYAGANLYAQAWDYSKVMAKLGQGEPLTQLGQALSMEDRLYKVQTQKGDIGWVRYTDVEKKP